MDPTPRSPAPAALLGEDPELPVGDPTREVDEDAGRHRPAAGGDPSQGGLAGGEAPEVPVTPTVATGEDPEPPVSG
jgi:hypothetical protein